MVYKSITDLFQSDGISLSQVTFPYSGVLRTKVGDIGLGADKFVINLLTLPVDQTTPRQDTLLRIGPHAYHLTVQADVLFFITVIHGACVMR